MRLPIKMSMKKIILLLTFFIFQTVWAQITCNPQNKLTQNASDVKDAACEEINSKGQCKSSVPQDSNAARSRIQKLFDLTEAPTQIENLRKNWDLIIKNTPTLAKFYAERNIKDIDAKVAPIPLMSWFADTQFNPSTKSSAEYKKAFIDKFVAFSQRFDCNPTFSKISNFVQSHPSIKPVVDSGMPPLELKKAIQAMTESVKNPQNVIELSKKMKKTSENSLNILNEAGMVTSDPKKATYDSLSTIEVCSSEPKFDGKVDARERFLPCAGNFRKNFEDNQFDISENELSQLLKSKESEDLSSCIKDRLAKGAKIHHASITSSASALNNRGEAETRFCKKGFKALSDARALTARKKILPGLFSASQKDGLDLAKLEVQIDSNGLNGDGTSGECPYVYKNGSETLKPFFNTKAGQEALDANRFVKIQITFEDVSNILQRKEVIYQPLYACKRIELKCQ